MGKTTHPVSFPASEFEVIETALMETARGRWFLAEFARRNRTADTELLLDAIARLESSLTESEVPPELDRMRMDLMEMSETIARTRQDIASVRAGDGSVMPVLAAVEVFDAIVSAAEKTTSEVLSAAEQVQETAWRLRQTDTDTAICDELDQLANSIHATSAFQDVTRQRTQKAIGALRYMESRVNTMINIWGLDDIEVIQEEEEDVAPGPHIPSGQTDEVEGHPGTASDALMERDLPLGHSADMDVGFAPEDEPVDLEALPRVGPADPGIEDAGWPESDIIAVDNPIAEHVEDMPADEDEPTEIGASAAADEDEPAEVGASVATDEDEHTEVGASAAADDDEPVEANTDAAAEASPAADADEPLSASSALLDDDHDLFASSEPPASSAQAVDENAVAPERAPEQVQETDPAETPATLAAPPAPERDAPVVETATSAGRSAAERISRLTSEERLALFS